MFAVQVIHYAHLVYLKVELERVHYSVDVTKRQKPYKIGSLRFNDRSFECLIVREDQSFVARCTHVSDTVIQTHYSGKIVAQRNGLILFIFSHSM